MRTNIEIDDRLIKQVIRYSGAATKKAAVDVAMQSYVQQEKQKRAAERLWGAVPDWEGDLEQSRLSRFQDTE